MFAQQQQQQQQQGPQAQTGPDLAEITTEAIAFQHISGDARLRIVPRWPTNNLPKPTSSLLSIASRQELLAAAGPDQLVLAATSSIRNAFSKDAPVENGIKSFQPELTLQIPRLSQVAFTSDESFLVLSAAEGGGLAVYEVSALKQGRQEPAFQLSTNGIPVRTLAPNPAQELGQFAALVLDQGQLMVADLKERKLENGQSGNPVLREGVSCVAWSNKGKALTAGFGNGGAVQLKSNGEQMVEIPRCPGLDEGMHVSSISWLDNEHWLMIYSPSQAGQEGVKDSLYVYVSREKNTSNFMFQKLPDPTVPFGMNRQPTNHFIARMREFPPALRDCLVLSATTSGDVGVIACHDTPLDQSIPDSAGKYTMTSVANDARKAQLPVDEEMADTSAIGLALDLSAKELVNKPLPAEEMEQSPTPLPGLALLNHEGVLSYWWFVYAQSIRERKGYQGLVALSGQQQQPQKTTPSSGGFLSGNKGPSAFGQPSTPSSVGFAKPSVPAFGSASTPQGTSGGGFGSVGGIGANKSPWATSASNPTTSTGSAFGQSAFGQAGQQQPAFGSSAFGQPSKPGGSGFGAVGGLGQTSSPWAQKQSQPQSESKPNPFSDGSNSSPFGAMSQQKTTPFGGMAGQASGFGDLGKNVSKPAWGAPSSGATAFGQQSSFGSTMTIGSSPFSQPSSFNEPKSAWNTPSLSQDASSQSGKPAFGALQSQESEMRDDDMNNETPKALQKTDDKPADSGFGLFSNQNQKQNNNQQSPFGGFKMQSSFQPDGQAKDDDKSKSSEPSLFGKDFGKTLNSKTEAGQRTEDKSAAKAPSLFGGQQPTDQTFASKSLFGEIPSGKTEDAEATAKAFDGKPIKQEPKDDMPPAPLPPSPSPTKKTPQPEPAPLPPSPKIGENQAMDEPPLPPSPKPQKDQKSELPPSPAGSSPVDLGEKSSSGLSSAETTPEKAQDKAKAEEPGTPEGAKHAANRGQSGWAFPSDTPKTAEPPTPSFTPSTVGKPEQGPSIFANKPTFNYPAPTESKRSPRSPSPTQRKGYLGGRSFTSPSPSRNRQISTTPTAPPPSQPRVVPPSRSPSRQSRFGESARMTPVQGPLDKGRPSQSRQASRDVDQSTVRRHPPKSSKPQEEEADAELFEEDTSASIQAELDAPLQPTKTLASFLAHQDYIGRARGSSLTTQCEIVYRDISSMIDTLGLNVRSLMSWVAGHEEFHDHERQRFDLEKDEDGDWSLIELSELGMIIRSITDDLEEDRIDCVKDKVDELLIVRKELVKLEHSHHSLQQSISIAQGATNSGTDDNPNAKSHLSPYRRTRSSASPSPFAALPPGALTPQQTRTILDLRKSNTSLTTRLSTLESSLSEFRARLASLDASSSSSPSMNGTPSKQPQKLPTVEAVLSTIHKMTRMIETKSTDLDVLEARLKRLRLARRNEGRALEDVLGGMSLVGGGRGSREGTPLNEALEGRFGRSVGAGYGSSLGKGAKESGKKVNGSGSGAGRFAVPDESDEDDDAAEGAYATPLNRSLGLHGRSPGSARRRDPKISDEEVEAFVRATERRKRVMEALRKKVGERGTRMSGVVDATRR